MGARHRDLCRCVFERCYGYFYTDESWTHNTWDYRLYNYGSIPESRRLMYRTFCGRRTRRSSHGAIGGKTCLARLTGHCGLYAWLLLSAVGYTIRTMRQNPVRLGSEPHLAAYLLRFARERLSALHAAHHGGASVQMWFCGGFGCSFGREPRPPVAEWDCAACRLGVFRILPRKEMRKESACGTDAAGGFLRSHCGARRL
ncbi:MAG: hypothetical protein ACLT98_10750 [Eggerthellaceae bacterium]